MFVNWEINYFQEVIYMLYGDAIIFLWKTANKRKLDTILYHIVRVYARVNIKRIVTYFIQIKYVKKKTLGGGYQNLNKRKINI